MDEKTNIKKKIFALLLLSAVTLGIFGCGKRKDVRSDDELQGDSVSDELCDSELAASLGTPKSLQVTDIDKGSSGLAILDINIDEIKGPVSKTMDLVSYEKINADTDMKKNMVHTIFDTEKNVTSATSAETFIKSDYEYEDSYYDSSIEAAEASGNDEDVDWLTSMKQDNLDKMTTAPEERLALDYSNGRFFGTISGIEYRMDISYSSSGNDGLLMSVSPQPDSRMIEVRPYDGANYVRFSSLLDEGFDEDTEGMENQCSKSETEALDMANSLLEDCGIDYTPKTISGLIWLYSTYEGGKTIASEVDGYKITYRNTINGESIYSKYLGEVDNIQNGDTLWDSTITDICELYINDKGVIYADIEEPVTQKEVLQEDVELLSFDEILEIAKSELGNYYSEYPTRSGEITFNSLELTYFYLQDKENENVYIATPVWIFSQVLDVDASDELSYPQQIFIINAMDGSIVYLQDER